MFTTDTWMTLVYAAISFVLSTALGFLLIPLLKKWHFGQTILTEYGPSWHASKQGTPLMGGFLFMGSTLVVYLIFGFGFYKTGEVSSSGTVLPTGVMTGLIVSFLFALLGFADDFIKATKKRNLGLTASQKLLIQILSGAVYLFTLALRTGNDTSMRIPFTDVRLELGFFYYVLALFMIVGFTNAVNLTDGVDGLCGTVTLPVMVFYSFAALVAAQPLKELSVVASALAGGICGFLVFNWHPAKVFMGDTGSMFLGGMVVTMAFELDMPLMLIVVGLVYLAEALSVMIQVSYFKLTHGKRLFKMTPIHHHFELSGYSEVKIVLLFSLVTLVLCVAGGLWLVL